MIQRIKLVIQCIAIRRIALSILGSNHDRNRNIRP
jgi:hypothetical protein